MITLNKSCKIVGILLKLDGRNVSTTLWELFRYVLGSTKMYCPIMETIGNNEYHVVQKWQILIPFISHFKNTTLIGKDQDYNPIPSIQDICTHKIDRFEVNWVMRRLLEYQTATLLVFWPLKRFRYVYPMTLATLEQTEIRFEVNYIVVSTKEQRVAVMIS